MTDKLATDKLATDKAATDELATDKAATDEAATDDDKYLRADANWSDSGLVADWLVAERSRNLFDPPRRITGAVLAAEGEPVRLVVDVGAGSGTYLALLLERFAEARGVWCDGSEAMEAEARQALSGFGDRVDYAIADLRQLSGIAPARSADVVVSSRASHHLLDAELPGFYREAAALLRPGGWIANLDHTGTHSPWGRRWRTAMDEVTAGARGVPHFHPQIPLASLETHLAALGAAGFVEVEVVWRTLQAVLVMGRATD